MSTPTTDGETFVVLRDLIAKDHAVAPETLTRETLLKTLEIDSLSLIELIFTLEERFDVEADKVPDDLPTLGSVADYIDGLIAARAVSIDDGAPAA